MLVHYIGDQIPPEFIKDRKEGYLGFDMLKSAMAPQFDQHVQFVRAQYAWLKAALAARPFLFGDAPSVADLACWQTPYCCARTARRRSTRCSGSHPWRSGTSASSRSATASRRR